MLASVASTPLLVSVPLPLSSKTLGVVPPMVPSNTVDVKSSLLATISAQAVKTAGSVTAATCGFCPAP